MDALRLLDFPENTFDLVNIRFGVSFLRIWDWAKLLQEMQRVVVHGGVVRLTECGIGPVSSTSPALLHLFDLLRQAFYRSGRLFYESRTSVLEALDPLMVQQGCRAVQTRSSLLHYQAGTPACHAFYEDWKRGFRMLLPFLVKWGCASDTYNEDIQQALENMQGAAFEATVDLLTIWGSSDEHFSFKHAAHPVSACDIGAVCV
jgi:SAM-dependent methyltransferase